MSQASPAIGANKSGLAYRLEDNDGKKALLTHHKGSAAPSYAEAGTLWLDDSTTPWAFKLFDGGDWITIGSLHAGNNSFLPYMGGTALRMAAYAADTGTVNAMVTSPIPAPPQHQAGQIVIVKPAYDVTGAATLTLGALDTRAIVRADGSPLFAADMLAGQVYLLVYDGTQFVVTNPSRNMNTPDGSIVASQTATYATYAQITGLIPLDNTVPQASEGTAILNLSHTPQSPSNRVRIRFSGFANSASDSVPIVAFLSIDGSAAVQAVAVSAGSAAMPAQVFFEYEHIPGDTSAHTYSVRVGPGGVGTVRFNGGATTRLFGGAAAARLTIEEVKA